MNDLPFDTVVLTFPDERAATVAAQGPLWRDLQAQYPSGVSFVATTDPFGCRVGSGGGTLAALAQARQSSSSSSSSRGNVLILHAGGQSSRCPTQMCFGKAWTTFPSHFSSGNRLVTPIHIWLNFMFHQFTSSYGRLPDGSVVVIAADTMLRIPPPPCRADKCDSTIQQPSQSWDLTSVLVMTVPSPLETAKNHGVFVLSQHDDTRVVSGCPVPCCQVLQKPSLETLQTLFSTTNKAWIDTGVLIFLPQAAAALERLALHEPNLYGCTRQGLEHLYQHHQQQAPSSLSDMTSFCAQHALSIDLYTHMLQSLQNAGGTSVMRETYQQQFPELPVAVAQTLFDALSPLSLQLLVEPEGHFLHLGTTAELMDFYTCLAEDQSDLSNLQTFAQELGLLRRQQVVLMSNDWEQPPSCGLDSVMYLSALKTDTNLQIGNRSLVEFCHAECSCLEIGDNCWISGLRGTTQDPVFIPNGMVVQELSLNRESRVYMVLGVNDPVKTATILYGRSWSRVASRTGWTAKEIWDSDNAASHTLWNAKIHPVVGTDEDLCFSKLFSWLLRLDSSHQDMHNDPALEQWRNRTRLSLAEIRQQADVSLEIEYRENVLKCAVPALRKQLRVRIRRGQSPNTSQSSWTEWKEDVRVSWETSVRNMNVWIANNMYDTLGALAMRYASSLLALLDESGPIEPSPVLKVAVAELINLQIAPMNKCNGWLTRILVKVNESLSVEKLSFQDCQALASIFLAITSACTRLCVGSALLDGSASTKPSATLNKWVVATAPARIDLAGGWSDTPPICFDGSVGKLTQVQALWQNNLQLMLSPLFQ